jgi:hypothetical protein
MMVSSFIYLFSISLTHSLSLSLNNNSTQLLLILLLLVVSLQHGNSNISSNFNKKNNKKQVNNSNNNDSSPSKTINKMNLLRWILIRLFSIFWILIMRIIIFMKRSITWLRPMFGNKKNETIFFRWGIVFITIKIT